MDVGIDITPIIYDRGVSRYTANLTRAMVAQKSGICWTMYGNSLRRHVELRKYVLSGSRNRIYRLPPSLVDFLFNRMRIPIEVFTGPLDVFHAWDWYVPGTRRAHLVTTVHDLALFKFEGVAHHAIKRHHSQALASALKHDAHFIAVSQSTKRDLIELFNVSADNITVIYEALPLETCKPYDPRLNQQVLALLEITKPFFLCVGTIEPRKNYPNIIKAFQKFAHEYQLVIVGQKGWQSLPLTHGVKVIGEVSPVELNVLYKNAAALIYASLYEGFGLPILEAFYHQLPVVTSNISSMSEVAGSAAALVDPLEPDSITQGIDQSINNRHKYSQAGIARLKHFSWEKAARETIQVYQAVAGKSQ
jgi:glycosyltransferase involved in cell wall biosynthesis